MNFVSIPQDHSQKGNTFLMATWISITLIAWVALSVVVSLVVGGMIRIADARRLASPADGELARAQRRPAPSPSPLRRVS